MEAASTTISPGTAPLLDELALLADPTRARMLAVLDGELTVAELCDVLALPQSTVSRHLKALAGAAWVRARRDGTSRYYRRTVDELGAASRRLWELVQESVAGTPTAASDRSRLERVLDRRRAGTSAFFATAAEEWDALRAELFGATSDLRLLPALLDPGAVVGDLGCGSGRVAAALAPFVKAIVAVDSSPQMLEVARTRLATAPNARVAAGSVERLPIADASLDAALLVHVLHHVADTGAALAEARRVLAPGGRLIVADMRPHDHEEYRATMGHVWLGFDRAYIEAAFETAGLVPERWLDLPVDAGTRGPGLFVATARRRAAPTPLQPITTPRGGQS